MTLTVEGADWPRRPSLGSVATVSTYPAPSAWSGSWPSQIRRSVTTMAWVTTPPFSEPRYCAQLQRSPVVGVLRLTPGSPPEVAHHQHATVSAVLERELRSRDSLEEVPARDDHADVRHVLVSGS